MEYMNILQMLRRGANPQQIVLSMIPDSKTNPVISNLVNLAQNGNSQQLEAFARNMFNEKGLDFDKEFNSFKNFLGIK